MLVARDKKALENLAEEVRAEGVQAKVVVEDFAKEGAVSRVVDKVPISSMHSNLLTPFDSRIFTQFPVSILLN